MDTMTYLAHSQLDYLSMKIIGMGGALEQRSFQVQACRSFRNGSDVDGMVIGWTQ
jgi:malate/lactate dehydrogenase